MCFTQHIDWDEAGPTVSSGDVSDEDEQQAFDELKTYVLAAMSTNMPVALACDDLDAILMELGTGFGTPVTLKRGDFKWRMAVPATGMLPFDGVAPALIQWDGDAHPAPRLNDSDCRLQDLVVFHPQACEMENLLRPYLQDDRVTFRKGAAQLVAAVATPDGLCKLS